MWTGQPGLGKGAWDWLCVPSSLLCPSLPHQLLRPTPWSLLREGRSRHLPPSPHDCSVFLVPEFLQWRCWPRALFPFLDQAFPGKGPCVLRLNFPWPWLCLPLQTGASNDGCVFPLRPSRLSPSDCCLVPLRMGVPKERDCVSPGQGPLGNELGLPPQEAP